MAPVVGILPYGRPLYLMQPVPWLLITWQCKDPRLHGHTDLVLPKYSGVRFNIKMSSYQYRKSHGGDKTVVRPSYLHNGISYTGKMIHCIFILKQGPGPISRSLNSLWPSDTIWYQGSGSTLVQVMACYLFGARPLPEPMITLLLVASLGINFNEMWCKIWNFSFLCNRAAILFRPQYVNTMLTHCGRAKMAAIFQTTFSNAFSCMKIYEFWLRFDFT